MARASRAIASVRPHLLLSSSLPEGDAQLLAAHGVTHVLQVGAELSPSHPGTFQYLRLDVWDLPEQDIVASFGQAFAFIEQALAAGGRALVHCAAGVSRSATVCIGYLMWRERLPAEAATQDVTAARSIVWPNAGFKAQLREFEALGCDATRWPGWDMQRYLQANYGPDNVTHLAAMLGGAPVDRRLAAAAASGAAGAGSGSSGGSGEGGTSSSTSSASAQARKAALLMAG